MEQGIIYIMMAFMVLGALDEALSGGRFGYGEQFKKGICAIGPLVLSMAGIMCMAPVLGKGIQVLFSGVYTWLGIDTGMVGGMVLAVDMGAFPLARQITGDSRVILLSGILTGSMTGCIISFMIPVGLSFCPGNKRAAAAKGLAIGLAAAPAGIVTGGLVGGLPLAWMVQSLIPVLLFSFALIMCLWRLPQKTISFFMGFARVLLGLGTLWLAMGILREMVGLVLLPQMSPLGEQLEAICKIGLTLAGAYPAVLFLQRHAKKVFAGAARLCQIQQDTMVGMAASLANPLLLFDQTSRLPEKDVVLAYAFASVVSAALGDHLGYVSVMYAQGILPMVIGKLAAGAVAVFLAGELQK